MTDTGNDQPVIADGTVPWAQQAAAPQERQTKRERRMVRDLPAWEPLPPGEMLVRRHQRY